MFLKHLKTFQKKKILVVILVVLILLIILVGRLAWLMIFKSEFYGERADRKSVV